MADLAAAGKAVLDSFIAALPEDLRGPATDMFGKPEAQKAIESIGNAAMMRADHSRAMNDTAMEKARAEESLRVATEHKARLDKWFADNQPLLTLGKKAQDAGWDDSTSTLQTPKPAELPADLVRKGELDSQAQLAVKYMNAALGLATKHLKEFGEVIDMDELITDPRVNTLGIQGVYDAKYRGRYDEKATKARDEDRAKFEAEIRADERKRAANRPLTPVGTDTSPLDALAQLTKPGTASVEDMAAEYERLVAAKG